jgi:hypothetical protein
MVQEASRYQVRVQRTGESFAVNLLKEVSKEIEEPSTDGEAQASPEVGPTVPAGWSVGHLANHGLILSCDGFQLKIDNVQLQKFFDIAEDGEPGEIKDQNGKVVLVEPTEDSIVLTRVNDDVYPSGVVLDMDTLKELGIEEGEPEAEDEPPTDDVTIELVDEAVKAAFRRSGKKIKKGFRVTSGYRKGRVVANIKTAYKPRAKASTRMKLSIAGRRKKIIRVLKSKRTRKKSLSKRLTRMNKAKR